MFTPINSSGFLGAPEVCLCTLPSLFLCSVRSACAELGYGEVGREMGEVWMKTWL